MENTSRKIKEETLYSQKMEASAVNLKYYGRMNAPTSSAHIKGPCGDEMEFYLIIEDETIKEISFYSKGCALSRICGSMTAELAMGKRIEEALDISPKKVIALVDGLPESHRHCSILAVNTLYKAIAEYTLKP